MTPITLHIGLSDSDRTRPLVDGTVPIEGVNARFELMAVQALFNRQLTEHTFDCCEFPLTTYLRTLDTPERPYVAIPVFPSRHFRLSCVFVNRRAGITKPADLAGRRVGVPVLDMAAAVWLRGIFQEHYGLGRNSPIYVTGGLEHARVGDEHPQFYPPQFKIERAQTSLAALLATGEVDALYTARAPSSFISGGDVVRLFEPPQAEELRYFRSTGIVPPMHIVCLKRSVLERDPAVCQRLYAAFAKAQGVARERIHDSAALSVMLPWLLEHLIETERLLGANFWPIGFRANVATLTKIIEYMRDDGLISRKFAAEDLFSDAAMLAT